MYKLFLEENNLSIRSEAGRSIGILFLMKKTKQLAQYQDTGFFLSCSTPEIGRMVSPCSFVNSCAWGQLLMGGEEIVLLISPVRKTV